MTTHFSATTQGLTTFIEDCNEVTISYAGNEILCEGETVVLTSSSPTGNLWSTGETNRSITISSPGTYSVMVPSISASSDPITFVDFVPVSQTNYTVSPNSISSLPLKVTVTTNANPAAYDYYWCSGNGEIVSVTTPVFDYYYHADGIYYTSLVLMDNNSGCTTTLYDPSNSGYTVICQTSQMQNCSFVPAITPVGPLTICPGSFVVLSASNLPGGSLLQWILNGTPLGGEVSTELMVTVAGIYTLKVTDPGGCSKISNPVSISMNTLGVPALNVSTLLLDSLCGTVSGSLVATTGYANYVWTNGQPGNVMSVNSGGVFSVNATAGNGCVYRSDEIKVSGSRLKTPEICMITADDNSTHFIITWSKPYSEIIEYFKVLRESPPGSDSYVVVGSVPYDSLSEYHDYSVDPDDGPQRYRLVSTDTCNGVSAPSESVESMYVEVTADGKNAHYISWNDYRSYSMQKKMYKVYAGPATGAISMLVDSVSNPLNFLYIKNPPFGPSTRYRVEMDLLTVCESTRAARGKSVSNGTGNLMLGQAKQSGIINAGITPNPNKGKFDLILPPNSNSSYSILMYNVAGVLVYSKSSISGNHTIEEPGLSDGLYFLHLQSSTNSEIIKVIVSK